MLLTMLIKVRFELKCLITIGASDFCFCSHHVCLCMLNGALALNLNDWKQVLQVNFFFSEVIITCNFNSLWFCRWCSNKSALYRNFFPQVAKGHVYFVNSDRRNQLLPFLFGLHQIFEACCLPGKIFDRCSLMTMDHDYKSDGSVLISVLISFTREFLLAWYRWF